MDRGVGIRFRGRNPLPGDDVEIGYRFERISDRTDARSTVAHKNEVSLALGLSATDWIGLSLEMPYQFLSSGGSPRRSSWISDGGSGEGL